MEGTTERVVIYTDRSRFTRGICTSRIVQTREVVYYTAAVDNELGDKDETSVDWINGFESRKNWGFFFRVLLHDSTTFVAP